MTPDYDTQIADLTTKIASLEAQISGLRSNHGSSDTSNPLHPHTHPHGSREKLGPGKIEELVKELVKELDRIEKSVDRLDQWKNSLRGQDGVSVNGSVISGPGTSSQQRVLLTLCVNGMPGYMIVPAIQLPTKF